jgi:predicted CXXCH cytochrome family protein
MLVCLLFAAGCSSQTKGRLLRVFFTGVDATNTVFVTTSTNLPAGTNTLVQAAIPTTAPVGSVHKPYLDRNCTACHLTAMSQELRVNGSGLCLECHDKLIGTAKYVHAPIAAGKCDDCHQGHESPEKALLLRKAQDLCVECHELPQMAQVRGHANIGSAECLSCHDPHRSEQQYLVKARP